MPYLNFKGKKIYYKLKENNIASSQNKGLIFIHGSGETSLIWQNQINEINLDYKLIAVDLPSHGNSDKFLISEIILDLYVNVIAKLKESLKLEKMILCGHSLGGAIILSCYLKNPNDIESLILCATGARLRTSPVIFQQLTDDYKQYLNYIRQTAFHRKAPKSVIDTYREQLSKVDPQVIYNDFKICDGFDIMQELKLIQIPCLILCGDSDVLTPTKYSQYFHTNIKDCKLHIIQQAGHMVMLEKPQLVNQYIQEFIEIL